MPKDKKTPEDKIVSQPKAAPKGQQQESPGMKVFFRLYAMTISWILSSYTFYNLERFRDIANKKGIGNEYLNFLYFCLAFATVGVTYLGFKALLYPDSIDKMSEAEIESKSRIIRAHTEDSKKKE